MSGFRFGILDWQEDFQAQKRQFLEKARKKIGL